MAIFHSYVKLIREYKHVTYSLHEFRLYSGLSMFDVLA